MRALGSVASGRSTDRKKPSVGADFDQIDARRTSQLADGFAPRPGPLRKSLTHRCAGSVQKELRAGFRIFQLQARDGDDLGEATLLGARGYTYGYRIGDLALVANGVTGLRVLNIWAAALP